MTQIEGRVLKWYNTSKKSKIKRKIWKLTQSRNYVQFKIQIIYRIKDFLQLKINIKVKILCIHVIPYIHPHKWISPYISMAITTMFAATSFIPEWKLGWTGKKVSPSALCLAQTYQILQMLYKTFHSPTGEWFLYGTTIHAALTLLAYVIQNTLPNKKTNTSNKNKQSSIETK